MKLAKILYIGLLVSTTLTMYGQTAHTYLKEGDNHYTNEQYDLAEESYRKAKEKGDNGKAAYNLGNALYEQERYEEALNQYNSTIANTTDSEVLADTYYNLGNAHVKNEKLNEGIQAYKQALQYNPNDEDAISNLLTTKMMLQQQQQQEQQQQSEDGEDDKDKEQEEQQEQQEQENQEQQSGEEDTKEEEQNPAEEKKELDKEDAKKLLEIIDKEEKKVQEKLRKSNGKQNPPEKDW